MSKTKLKKYLQSLTQDQIIQVVLDLYDARKDAKEYLEFFMNPDSKEALEKTKKELFRNYFTPQGCTRARVSVKEGNDIVTDFVKLDTDPETTANLFLYHAEVMISRLVLRRLVRETAWNSLVSTFRKAIDYILSYRLKERFGRRVEKFIEYADNAPDYLRVPERLIQELEEAGYNFEDYNEYRKEEYDEGKI